jgi:ubiquinone/menaquinone biosynthesis C-methylase UbiE
MNNDDFLDLGCGVGNLTLKIREITKAKVMGIDPSEGMIKKATEVVPDLPFKCIINKKTKKRYE